MTARMLVRGPPRTGRPRGRRDTRRRPWLARRSRVAPRQPRGPGVPQDHQPSTRPGRMPGGSAGPGRPSGAKARRGEGQRREGRGSRRRSSSARSRSTRSAGRPAAPRARRLPRRPEPRQSDPSRTGRLTRQAVRGRRCSAAAATTP